jgi:hypothetical protein
MPSPSHKFPLPGRAPDLFSSADTPSSDFRAPEMNAIRASQQGKPSTRDGPPNEGTLSNGRCRERLNDEDLDSDAVPDGSLRGRGEVALLCVIGGLDG